MKTAIISVTYKGALLADRLADISNQSIDVYAKNGRNTAKADYLFEHMGPIVEKLFKEYNNSSFAPRKWQRILDKTRQRLKPNAQLTFKKAGNF